VVAAAVAATTVAVAAAMTEPIDPGLSVPNSTGPIAAERLAALRKPNVKRAKPAHTSKIVAAGLSTTALFGMVAAMGWPTATGIALSAPPQTTPTTTAAPVVASTTTPPSVSTIPIVPTVPTTAVPVVIPETTPAVPETTPIVVPPAIPVVQVPVQNAPKKRTKSNTATKSSG
jgi:hypothetical protein